MTARATDLTLHVFDCGYLDATDVQFIAAAGKVKLVTARWANRSYLIKHPEGLLLWDTGLSDIYIDDPEGSAFGPWRLVVTKTLSACLDELGVGPGDITYLLLPPAYRPYGKCQPLCRCDGAGPRAGA